LLAEMNQGETLQHLEMSNAFFPSEVVANAVGAIYSRFTLRRFPYES
jgi:hypothetical protein